MTIPAATSLPDAPARDAFTQATERPFSVVAPAGVGKTHAITERLLALAKRPDAIEVLPRLVVVTYTKRAAQEMQSRARARLLEAHLGGEVERAFGQAFFGTIHSLCVRLIRTHGHALGLPPSPQLIENEEEVWAAFWDSEEADAVWRRDPGYRQVLQLCPLGKVQQLARNWPGRKEGKGDSLPPRPGLDASDVWAIPATGRSANTIERSQRQLRRFDDAVTAGDRHALWPSLESRDKKFHQAWQACLQPMRDWLRAGLIQLAGELAAAARDYRRRLGLLGYDDQVSFAAELLALPAVAEEIAARRPLVILDEAQDTDPVQFEVLRRLTGDGENPSEDPARWVMVGDPQQSIYPDRADLAVYLERAAAFGDDAQASFEVTFRCDEAVVAWVNRVMPALLDGAHGQTAYVALTPGPRARDGQVVRLPVGSNPEPLAAESGKRAAPKAEALARMAAGEIAGFLQKTGLDGLRAREWGEVALLCPRRKQLDLLDAELRRAGFRTQNQSARDWRGDHPVYAWMAGIVRCLAHPWDGFEVVGVLREVFGCSDHDLAMASQGDPRYWDVNRPAQATGYDLVDVARAALHTAWKQAATLPLGKLLPWLDQRWGLRERLGRIGPEMAFPAPAMTDEWQRLQVEALQAERDGLTLPEWAEQLRRGFELARDENASAPDAIQLLTYQKAKGLEWDAVILPLLFYPLKERAPEHPRVWRRAGVGPPGSLGPPGLKLDPEDETALGDPERGLCQHYQRLLYVGMTRARHTLILTDDEAMFARAHGATSQNSLGRVLLAKQDETSANRANRAAWDALPTDVVAELTLRADAPPEDRASSSRPSGGVPSGSTILARARAVAADFPRRVTPHALARHVNPEEPEVRAEGANAASPDEDRPGLPARTPATLYGTWWHELMEQLPWNASEEALRDCYQSALPSSPDPERSAREWDLLLGSELGAQLRQPGMIARAEVPFLWKSQPDLVVEGVADLAVWEETTRTWWVVDWKTNRLASARAGLEALHEEYAPQVRAYLEAWRALFPGAAAYRGVLYSTQWGQGVTVGRLASER